MNYEDPTTIFCGVRNYRVCHNKIRQIARTTCDHLHLKRFALSVSFVSVEKVRKLNKDFRGIDRPTDVLAFPLFPSSALRNGLPFDHVLGDVVICATVAAKNALCLGQSLGREVCFLLVHGILHLCGYDHQQPREEAAMLAAQQQIMATLDERVWRECVMLRDVGRS